MLPDDAVNAYGTPEAHGHQHTDTAFSSSPEDYWDYINRLRGSNDQPTQGTPEGQPPSAQEALDSINRLVKLDRRRSSPEFRREANEGIRQQRDGR